MSFDGRDFELSYEDGAGITVVCVACREPRLVGHWPSLTTVVTAADEHRCAEPL